MTVLYCVDPALVRVWHVPFSDVTSKTASECLDSAKSGCPLMVAVIDARTVPVIIPVSGVTSSTEMLSEDLIYDSSI